MSPFVSIIILTYNAAPWFKDSLPHFLSQAYDGEWEILVIDSGSTDETLQLLDIHDRIRVHSIPNEEFGHGKTRNFAASIAKGELLLYTVQDACPSRDHWMKNMVESLLENNLDAVCGGQAVPHDLDKNPVQWYRPISERADVEVIRGTQFNQWTPAQQMNACGWDNVNALYKKEALNQLPFQDIRFGEDMTWAKMRLMAHGDIGYAKSQKVWHYHHQHPGFTRPRVINQLHWRHLTFGVLPPSSERPNFWHVVKVIKAVAWNARIWNPLKILNWIQYNWTMQLEAHHASEEYREAFSKGNEEIDRLYHSLGSKSPMATKYPPQ